MCKSPLEVCLVSHPEGHAMLIVEDVVPKLMRVIGEIKDFLPRFKFLCLHCHGASAGPMIIV